MKKIALIISFCDTFEKEEVLYSNTIKLKSLGLDVMILSPLTLSKKNIDACDFYFQTKENPVLHWPEYMQEMWYSIVNSDGDLIKLKRGVLDYGYAGLYQIKKISQIVLGFDYDLHYFMIYDLLIDARVEKDIIEGSFNLIYPRRHPIKKDWVWSASQNFMILDREKTHKISLDISKERYLESNQIAEEHAVRWANEYEIEISDYPVTDQISYWDEPNLFNYSKNEKYDIFWGKNDIQKFRFIINKNDEYSEIKVHLNSKEYFPPSGKWIIVETEEDLVMDFSISGRDFLDNYIDEYNQTSRNFIIKEEK